MVVKGVKGDMMFDVKVFDELYLSRSLTRACEAFGYKKLILI